MVNKSSAVDKKEFSEICPALIQQLTSKSCVSEEEHRTSGHDPDDPDDHGKQLSLLIILILII
jgi:hypothetical protein